MVSKLRLFCLATYLATFQKIVPVFPNHMVTLICAKKKKSFIKWPPSVALFLHFFSKKSFYKVFRMCS